MNPYKITVVRQISIKGLGLYSKPERAARDYTTMQCQDWWQRYLARQPKTTSSYGRPSYVSVDIALLHERQVRMLRRVLPIFKRMLAD